MEFKSSAFLSLGLELELQLVNKNNHDLTARALEFISNFSAPEFNSQLHPEITQSMLEINSSIHSHPSTLKTELCIMREALLNTSSTLGLLIMGGGAHPFQMWHDRKIYPDPHYKRAEKNYGYLAKMFTVFGMHIHLGCTSANDAIYLMNALTRYIPHFIALSASSPFSQGVDTGYESSRSNVVKMFPLSGLAPSVSSWEDFSNWLVSVQKLRIVENINNFYWDIRPKPEFGTVEIRVCDTPLTIERAVQIAAYAQCLSRSILMDRESPFIHHDLLIYEYNRHQASFNGYSANFINPYTMESQSLKSDILSTLETLHSHACALGNQSYLSSLLDLVQNNHNDSKKLRDFFSENKSLHSLVEYQNRLFSNEETQSALELETSNKTLSEPLHV